MPVRLQCPNPDCSASFSALESDAPRFRRCPQCGWELSGVGTSEPIFPGAGDAGLLVSSSASSLSELTQGTIFARRYTIIKPLGRGGMGAVYLARDIELEREVVLKIPFLLGDDPEFRQRFRSEARAVERLSHANICAILDVGEYDGQPYITMAYVEGVLLSDYIKQCPEPLDPQEAVRLVRKLAQTLEFAHQNWVVHRDLKPSNIMLNDVAGPILMDFGLARREGRQDALHTRPGQQLGTPAYMPVEQFQGKIEAIGPRSDIYSLGVILFELLTGRRPYEGNAFEIHLKVVKSAKPPSPSSIRPGLDPALDFICQKAMARPIEDRYATMREFDLALMELTSPSAVTAPSMSTVREAFEARWRAGRAPRIEDFLADAIEPLHAELLGELLTVELELRATAGENPVLEDYLSRFPDNAPLLRSCFESARIAAEGALSPSIAPRPAGWFTGLVRRLVRSIRNATHRSGGLIMPAAESPPRREEEAPPTKEFGASIRRRAHLSFPAQVLIGQPQLLRVQLVPVEGDSRVGICSERPRPDVDLWTTNHLVSFFSSPIGTGAPPPIEVIVSLVAENFEVSGTGRAELIAPLEGLSNTVQFSLRGLEVGPGRVMIDFAQGGRPIGSVDLTPEVVAAIDARSPSSPPALPAESLTLSLATGPSPPCPDLVIKVYEHRLAGHAGRLQFVLSSTRRALSDLPVLDGDIGTLDLRAELVDWVGEQLRAVGAVAQQPDITAEEAERTMARIGGNLFQQLLPPSLQNLCWTFRERGVRAVMILSDEPHIPWELIKPYRDNPRTGDFEEDEFWGHSYALTHWLRGRPPVQRLSLNRICALAAKLNRPSVGEPTSVRNMVASTAPPASIAEKDPRGSAIQLMPIDEELEVIRSLEASGSRVRFLPARRREILGLLEQGEFDLLHLITHGDFGGLRAADASAVQVEDGAVLVAELSPRMAAALRRAAPLIFFNSCHTGRIGFSLTRLGSWGAQFVNSGCGGFVGSLWPVTDRAALAFAQAFYGRMCQGLPIGQAMMAARQQVRERYPNDPTWLAYRCFADPMALVEPPRASVC
jgi:serine/threonine protein kinase